MQVNQTQLAEAFNVSKPTVQQWVRQGCPIAHRGGRGKPHRFNLSDVIEWRDERILELIAEDGEAVTLEEARKRRELAQARLYEITYAERRRSLIEVEEVERQMSTDYQAIRARMRELPREIAKAITGETKPARAEALINNCVDGALGDVAYMNLD